MKEDTSFVSFRLDKDIAHEFKSLCSKHGTTIKFVLTRAVKEYIARNREKPE